jgi:hypothetical protein
MCRRLAASRMGAPPLAEGHEAPAYLLELARAVVRNHDIRRIGRSGSRRLEHFPEKWTPVFRNEMRQTSNLERFPAMSGEISKST